MEIFKKNGKNNNEQSWISTKECPPTVHDAVKNHVLAKASVGTVMEIPYDFVANDPRFWCYWKHIK